MSDTQTANLTDFLLERIAEDEAAARAAGWHGSVDYSEWEYAAPSWGAMRVQAVSTHGTPGYEDHVGITHDSEGLSDSVDEHAGAHIARHDPARVLAECEAKRRIVAEHEMTEIRPDDRVEGYSWDAYCRQCTMDGEYTDITREPRENPCPTLRALALPFADHPDYRAEWAL